MDIWTDSTGDILNGITVDPPDEQIRKEVQCNWDNIAKPLDGMGVFEGFIAQIGAILGTAQIDISSKAVIVMCADNGIVQEGISQSGQEVTAAVAEQMGKGCSSVGRMASLIGADTIPVDIGICQTEQIVGVLDRKIRRGTGNFKEAPAMTFQEAIQAIHVGMDLVSECKKKGYRLLGTGEMGIGNTTTSSASAAALLHCAAEDVTGRGAGLSDRRLRHKQQVIAEALERYELWHMPPLGVLCTVGGLDLAGLAGVCIGGACCHIPIVLDGVISLTAALFAERLVPGTVQYLIPSHRGKEPALKLLLQELGLSPVIDAGMALGEGTGAVMMMQLLEMALCIYRGQTTFSDIRILPYERYLKK